MKTCKQIAAEYREAHHEIYVRERAEMRVARDREFPTGTAVTWRHGLLTVKGKVVSLRDWDEESVEVKRIGAKHPMTKKAWELTAVVRTNLCSHSRSTPLPALAFDAPDAMTR